MKIQWHSQDLSYLQIQKQNVLLDFYASFIIWWKDRALYIDKRNDTVVST